MMRYCQKHRGMESAEEGICEVAGALLLANVDSSCHLDDALVIRRESFLALMDPILDLIPQQQWESLMAQLVREGGGN